MSHKILKTEDQISKFFEKHFSFLIPLIRRGTQTALTFDCIKKFVHFCKIRKSKGQDLIKEMILFPDLKMIYEKNNSKFLWKGCDFNFSKNKTKKNKNLIKKRKKWSDGMGKLIFIIFFELN